MPHHYRPNEARGDLPVAPEALGCAGTLQVVTGSGCLDRKSC